MNIIGIQYLIYRKNTLHSLLVLAFARVVGLCVAVKNTAQRLAETFGKMTYQQGLKFFVLFRM